MIKQIEKRKKEMQKLVAKRNRGFLISFYQDRPKTLAVAVLAGAVIGVLAFKSFKDKA